MITLIRNILTSAAAAVLLVVVGTGQVSAQEDHPAQVVVQTAVSNMLGFLADNIDEVKSNPKLLEDKVDEVIVPSIDFLAMTRLSVGKNWRKADEQQQEELVKEFQIL